MNTRNFLIAVLVVYTCCSFAQHPISISPRIDTTNIRNKAILELWQEYRQKRFENTFRRQTHDLSKYWAGSELVYRSFDFYRERLLKFDYLYVITPSYTLKIDSIDSDMFSLQILSMLDNTHRDSVPKCEDYYPAVLFSIKIIRDSIGYKLVNTFTFNKAKKQIYNIPPIRYYYDKDYPFDSLEVLQAHQKLLDFSEKYQLPFLNEPLIEFFVYPSVSIMNKDFGFDIHPFSQPSDIAPDIGGTQISENRMVFYGGLKSEGNIHEVLHILLRQITPKPTWFEEGVCTYYGGSVGKPYEEQKARLIKYLKEHPQEDFSKTDVFNFSDLGYNYTYAIMAVLAEYAEKQWGAERVLEMLRFETEANKNKSDFDAFWSLVSIYFETDKSEFALLLREILEINNK